MYLVDMMEFLSKFLFNFGGTNALGRFSGTRSTKEAIISLAVRPQPLEAVI